MQDFSKIKLKIAEYLETKGITDTEFYRQTGITRGVLRQSNGISEDNLSRFIATYPEINLNWLLKGEGEMIGDQDFSNTENTTDCLKQLLTDHTSLVDSHQKLTDAHYLLTVALTEKSKESKSYNLPSGTRFVAESEIEYKKE